MTSAYELVGDARAGQPVGDAGRIEVFTATQPPAWLRRWCDRRGMELAVHSLTEPSAPWPSVSVLDRIDHLDQQHHWVFLDSAGDRPRPGSPVVVGVQRWPDDAAVVHAAAASAAELGTGLRIVHAVPRGFAERSVGVDAEVARGSRLLTRAGTMAAGSAPALPITRELVRCRPEELVTGPCGAALLVVGRPPRLSTGHGLVAAAAVTGWKRPVLLVPSGAQF